MSLEASVLLGILGILFVYIRYSERIHIWQSFIKFSRTRVFYPSPSYGIHQTRWIKLQINILGYVEAMPSSSCKQMGEGTGVNYAQKILLKYKYRPYKLNICTRVMTNAESSFADGMYNKLILTYVIRWNFNSHNARNRSSENQQQRQFGVGI